MQPYFDPTRKKTSQKNEKRPKKKWKMEDDLNFKAVLLSWYHNKNLKNKWFWHHRDWPSLPCTIKHKVHFEDSKHRKMIWPLSRVVYIFCHCLWTRFRRHFALVSVGIDSNKIDCFVHFEKVSYAPFKIVQIQYKLLESARNVFK